MVVGYIVLLKMLSHLKPCCTRKKYLLKVEYNAEKYYYIAIII